MIVAAILILWVIPIVVGHKIGAPKSRAGLLYGLFLGWLGVVIVAMLPPIANTETHHECPHCKERMRRDASVCPHCRTQVGQTV